MAADGNKSLKKGLGKGINALIPEIEDGSNDAVITLNINEIEPNREQPRKYFDEAALSELSESVSAFGVIQPLIVRQNDGYYEIVAGERRWRAARMAGLIDVPVIVRDYDELKALEVSLIENLQRENLNAVEEALTYKRLQEEFSMTQEQIATRVGKKRPTIANSLRILSLPEGVRALLADGKISAGHAKALLAIDDGEMQEQVARLISESDMSVRQVEALMKKIATDEKPAKKSASPRVSAEDAIYRKSAERELAAILGSRVKLRDGKNKGKIEIEYFSDADLDRLLGLFRKLED